MKSFTEKTVVITGAASGMGRAYAVMFAQAGSNLALCDYDAQGLDETAALVNAARMTMTLEKAADDKKLYLEAFDISDRNAVYTFADNVKSQLGNAHIVINNAGIEGSNSPVWAMADESYQRVMAVNFNGVLYGTRAFLPQLIEQGEAAIVNVSSIFGLVGTPNNSDYCASKFAVRGFTEALMVELSQSHIQVHLVHPGGIDTNITRAQESQEFSKKFLTTAPEDICRYVMKGILNNKPRMVYGNNGFRTWLGSRILSTGLIQKLLWKEMSPVINMADYTKRILGK